MSTPPPQQPAPQQPPTGGGPYGYAYPQAPRPVWGPPGLTLRPPLNGLALASLLVGLLCLPPLGIVFGVVALVQIARKGERGRALAVVGLVVSVAMSAVLVLSVGHYGRPFLERLGAAQRQERPDGQLAAMDELRSGDCFNVPRGDLLAEVHFIYRVGCDQVHDAEVTATSILAPSAAPGASKAKEAAENTCWKAQDAYAMDTWGLPEYAEMYYFAPTRETWRDGDRTLLCLIGTADGEHRGSLRKDAGMLTSDQVALLKALNETDEALGAGPEGRPAEHLSEYETWAREVDVALGGQERMLRGVTSRPGVGPAAAARLKEVEAARKEWQRAARAATAVEFQRAWDAALDATSTDAEKALRGAYGLSTRVPSWLEGGPNGPVGGPGGGPSSESV